jgi:hypothetical protein
MTATKKSKRTIHHERQVEAGRRLVQFYLAADLHERMALLARKQGVPIWHVYAEAAEDYADRAERDEADALRAVFGLRQNPIRAAEMVSAT